MALEYGSEERLFSLIHNIEPMENSEGGGAGKFCRDRLFILITGWAGLFTCIFRYTKDRIFIFNYFNYNKNLTSKKKGGGGAQCFPHFHML